MRAEIDTAEEVTVVRVRGEFDLAGVDTFRRAVAEAGGKGSDVVEIDLRDVSFIDSSGVGAIVVAARDAAAGGRHIRIGARSSVVERVLEVSGVEEALREAGAQHTDD